MKYFLLLNIFLSQFCFGQECDCDSLFNRFRKDVQFQLARSWHDEVYYLYWDYDTKESYYTLMINCPVGGLVKYTDDSIPAIRAIIFGGLSQKNASDDLLREILAKHKNDTATYGESTGDAGVTWIVRDYMQWIVKWKTEKILPNKNYSFEERLAAIRNEPHYIIPGLYHGTVPKDSLLKLDSLTYSRKDVRITSFSISLSDSIDLKTSGNIFTSQMKECIKSTSPGWFYIDDIRAETADKKRVKLPSVALRIR